MRSRRRSKSRSTISERLLSLSVDQKLELALREMEDSKEEAQRDAEIADRILQSFKVHPLKFVHFPVFYKDIYYVKSFSIQLSDSLMLSPEMTQDLFSALLGHDGGSWDSQHGN